jgi:hypothetical protein
MNGNLVMINLKSFRSRHGRRVGRQRHIEHPSALGAVIMAVLFHVRAVTRGAAIQHHQPHQAAFQQRVKTVIDRGVRNIRHRVLGADEHLLRGRMIALLQQHVVHVPALRREPEAAGGQPLRQRAMCFGVRAWINGLIGNLTPDAALSRFGIIPNNDLRADLLAEQVTAQGKGAALFRRGELCEPLHLPGNQYIEASYNSALRCMG